MTRNRRRCPPPIEVSEQEWQSLTDELAAMERTDPSVAEAARRYDQMRDRVTADLPDAYLFGPRGAVGRNDYGPGHYLWNRHGERMSVRHPMWRVDGTLAPCRDLRTGTIVWGQPAWTCTECQQGEFLIHRSINGSTVVAWWDRTQGDSRPGSNVALIVGGRHDATVMLGVLRLLYPVALANLERVGVTLREVKP